MKISIIILLSSSVLCLKAQQISFTFSAELNCSYISIDSIHVKNLTQSCDTILFFPDTVLNFELNNIESITGDFKNFYVYQNYPNPYHKYTTIDINVPEKKFYDINIYDVSGKNILSYGIEFECGVNSFEFMGNSSNIYIFTVSSRNHFDKIKMSPIKTSGEITEKLYYIGNFTDITNKNLTQETKSTFRSPYFSYIVGDELKVTVWVTHPQNIVLSKDLIITPTESQFFHFGIDNSAPISPVELYYLPFENEINWNWSPVSSATGYRYNLFNNFQTSVDNGLKTSLILTGLECETFYSLYVWAYNACGKSDALIMHASTEECTWTCGEDYIFQGRAYKTVKIADQCWFAENINVGTKVNGNDDQDCDCNNIQKYCYANSDSKCEVYGGLYQWDQAMCGDTAAGVQGICPGGWRIPTDEDFKELEMFLGMTQLSANSTGWRGTNQGSKLAGKNFLWIVGELINNPEFGSTGFDALPGGHISPSGVSIGLGFSGKWWTSSENQDFAWKRRMSYNNTTVYRNTESKNNGFYIRCVREFY